MTEVKGKSAARLSHLSAKRAVGPSQKRNPYPDIRQGVECLILRKRRSPRAVWDEKHECFNIPNGPSFAAALFHEAPDLISCASVYALGGKWELPSQVVQAVFEELPSEEMN